MQIWHSDRPFGTKMASLSLNRSWLRARLVAIIVIAAAALAAAQNAAPVAAPAQEAICAPDQDPVQSGCVRIAYLVGEAG